MCFGKSGGRCKSLQCWIMSRTCVAMKRGVFVLLSRVSLFALVRSVCGRGNHPPLVVHSRGGWGVSAHQPISDPWLISGAPWRDDCETEALLKKQNKKHNTSGAVFPENRSDFLKMSNTEVRASRRADSYLQLRGCGAPDAQARVLTGEELCQRRFWFRGVAASAGPIQTSSDTTLPGLHRRQLKVTMKQQLWAHPVPSDRLRVRTWSRERMK